MWLKVQYHRMKKPIVQGFRTNEKTVGFNKKRLFSVEFVIKLYSEKTGRYITEQCKSDINRVLRSPAINRFVFSDANRFSALSANQFFLLRLKEISLSSKPSDIPSFLKHSEAFSE